MMNHKRYSSDSSVFILLIFAAFIVSYIPFLNLPFKWIETFFHELSHGIAAIISGGSIDRIELEISGAGKCYTVGGIRFLTAFSGYFGAVIWGMLIYEISDESHPKLANYIAAILVLIIAVSTLLWGSDVITYIISIFMIAIFALIIKIKSHHYSRISLKFIGIYTLLGAIKSPLYLIDGKSYGDGATLQKVTGLPELIWVLLWLLIGLFGLYYLWKNSSNLTEK